MIDLPLASDRDRPPRHKVDHENGRPATTTWRLVSTRCDTRTGVPCSLVDLEPLTGRSHQLRVHLAAIGCPIMGDRLYGCPPHDEAYPLALHATSLAFRHPATGEPLRFIVSPPSTLPWVDFMTDISEALAFLRP